MCNVYVCGCVGNLGTKIIIQKKYDVLRTHFSDTYLTKVLEDVEDGLTPSFDLEKYHIVDFEEVKKGGVLASLWKICERNKCGLEYDMSKIPILQGTIEVTNYFEINPYRLLSENVYIIFSAEELDLPKVGITTNRPQRIRVDGEVPAFLIKLYKDEIDKVL